jgi:hypothetical protein
LIPSSSAVEKISWQGVLISVQPRIRLSRSFDERSHAYLGYALRVRGSIGGEAREFLVGVGEGAHAKHRFRAGHTVSRDVLSVADPRLETVKFYKASGSRMIVDQWNPDRRRYRTEIFCYGPLSCPLHRSGPPRKVPGRRGMTYTEADWIDEEATSHRGPDE